MCQLFGRRIASNRARVGNGRPTTGSARSGARQGDGFTSRLGTTEIGAAGFEGDGVQSRANVCAGGSLMGRGRWPLTCTAEDCSHDRKYGETG